MDKSTEIFLNVEFGNDSSQFSGRSVEDGLPVTAPLCDLEDLLSWKPDDERDSGQIFSVATVPYLGKEIPTGSTKTLVCHDMAGGYVDDRFVQGNLSTDDKWYYLAYWDVVDTFVYFSHHFITIPPVGWINSAHANGVAVLGTFITEDFSGFSKRCEAIFSYDYLWKLVADKLVEIAKYYRFEGWLLNIENKLDKLNRENMLNFVKYLTDKMHDAIEGSQVIWYDSVTVDGVLKWQNELNAKNGAYFDVCDGIFLNYGWNEKSLNNSVKFAEKTQRIQDVYVGIDVFGRGCYGGGGMNSAVALKVIRKYNLSTAVFAPGWVKEVLGSENFEENQRKFWASLFPFCNRHHMICDNKVPYLATNLNPGMSIAFKKDETPECSKNLLRFLHLNRQSLMPSVSEVAFDPIPLTKSHQHLIKISGSSRVDLFRNQFMVSGYWLLVYIKENPQFQHRIHPEIFIVNENQYLQSVAMTFKEGNYWLFKFNDDSPKTCQLLCRTDGKAGLERILLIDIGKDQTPEQWFQNKEQQTLRIGVKCEDVYWKKSPEKDVFLLNGTLVFDNIDETNPLWITYKTLGLDFEDLGLSRCKKFRIKDLPVPSPVYRADVHLVVKVEQISPIFPFVHKDYPSRCGELSIQYAENIK